MNKVLIVSTDKYPNGNAGAIRQHAFAKLFELCGYNSIVIGLGNSTKYEEMEYESIKYLSFRAENNNLINRLMNIVLFKARLKSYLRNNSDLSIIMVVSLPYNALSYLKRYAKNNNVKMIHDCVEWYSPEEYPLNRFSPAYIINNSYNRKWIDNSFSVIAISTYLHTHFRSRNISTVRIPVIMDVKSMSYSKKTNTDKLTLVYAGSVGRKDYLKEIVEGLGLLEDKELMKIELRIFGISESKFNHDIGLSSETISKLSSCIKCFGRVTRDTVLKSLEEADFTVLLRSQNQRYAKAGFPTKVVESLASATPVILNITSDLDKYIKNNINGIIVKECTPNAFKEAILNALRLSSFQKAKMCEAARKCAEQHFDFRAYIDDIRFLLMQ